MAKPCSSKPINGGSGPPTVHQAGGPNFGQIYRARFRRVWGSRYPGLRCQDA